MPPSSAVQRSLARLAEVTEREDPAFAEYRRKIERLKTLHLPMARREKALSMRLKALIAHVLATGPDGERREEGNFLAVLGPSGAGKTRLCDRVFSSFEGLRTFEDDEGTVRPLITIRAPRPCESREFAIIMLQALGMRQENFPGVADLTRVRAWAMVRRLLVECGTLIVHVDEFQHVAEADLIDAEEVVDTLKNISQQTDNPVSLVFSGLPKIQGFIAGRFGNPQVMRRDNFFEVPPLDIARDRRKLIDYVAEVARTAGLADRTATQGDFVERLVHASTGQLGRFGILASLAANEALLLRDETLEPGHFAEAVRLLTLCADEQNVFLVSDWPEMAVWPDDPQTAILIARDEEEFYASPKRRQVSRKRGRAPKAQEQ
ncbi:hypothetical protein E3C22_19595 [Jiella endophytica]|uniref:ORC1/DEAH AAA+ ATPase domain-containing protein n=1 Tax=Jiella endophytica TaxID=2558362 RepID=A0A4Y8REP8_9HYPH|nr:ATP-binding protein [Jiella endophytica]TFF19870.1 hypothetical protein E3C22_19595 [Jiella endophytica]